MMRYLRYYFLLLALGFSFSCAEKSEPTPSPEPTPEKIGPITFSVSNDDSQEQKSSLVDGKMISFDAGDKMSVFDGSSNNMFETEKGGIPGMFKGTAIQGKEKYYLLFPYQSSASLSAGSIIAILPASQTVTEGSFDPSAILAVGTGKENQAVMLKNVNAFLMFTVNDVADVASINLKSDSSLGGTVVINLETGEITSVSNAAKEITITGTFTTGKTYYISVLPGNYTSLEFSVTDSYGDVSKKTASSFTIGKGKIFDLGTIGTEPQTTGNPLCFTAQEINSTVALVKEGTPYDVSLSISTDGSTWSDYSFGNRITLSNVGDKVYFRNKSQFVTEFSKDYNNFYYFSMTGKIAASGSAMSLIDRKLKVKSLNNSALNYLFWECKSLSEAPELPAITLAEGCYEGMFFNCANLTSAPELPATTLAEFCYGYMFLGCRSLIKAPELPATTLSPYCYVAMFKECISLTKIPELSVTTLAEGCYRAMFDFCTSLTEIPELPAITLSPYCYASMFRDCRNLTETPELPATTLSEGCYEEMFNGCKKLSCIKVKTIGNSSNWVLGVASDGTFICPSSVHAPGIVTDGSASTIPNGWEVVNSDK